MKVVTIVGTRPELIKLSLVIKELDKRVDHILAHTGQNYAYELNKIFFDEMNIREPDYFMDAVGQTAIETIGKIMRSTEILLDIEKPDALLILGDTNSSLSAYVAKRMHIPIFHMEAGNRCFDDRVPEEINRKIVDHLSDINMVYTEHARRYLIREGIKQEQIIKTGTPMYEIVNEYHHDIHTRKTFKDLGYEWQKYYLVSCHREENVDSTERLCAFMEVLEQLSKDCPVLVSAHPRLMNKLNIEELEKNNSRIKFSKPFGFIDYCNLQVHAKCVVSDSGTITEESSLLEFPAVTIRQAHERPEGMDTGTLIMSDLVPERVMEAINTVTSHKNMEVIPVDYVAPDLSKQVVRIILSYTDYINRRTWYK
jgi:UDP-N-acetylglucosamine 2-epimerase (non-hydrolysing)